MTFLRVKQAQIALADGRLDEAHELLSRDEVRSHRHGQRLTTKLVKAYVKRGRTHLQEGRLPEALADCEKAGSLGGHGAEVGELRQEVIAQMDARRSESQRRVLTLGAANQHARAGFLSAGESMLRDVNGKNTQVLQAQQSFELHRAKADASLERAEAALKREDWSAAGHHLAEARRLRPYDRRTDSLAGRLSDKAAAQIGDAIRRGRVDSAEALLRAVAPVAGDRLALRELREVVDQAAGASSAFARGDARSAGRALRRVKALMPEANWVGEAIKLADRIAESRDELEAGPLGLISKSYAPDITADTQPLAPPTPQSGPDPAIPYHHGLGSHDLLPKHFLIQVDGSGSALTSCEGMVTIGPISSKDRPQIGLIADPGVPTVTLQRVQDDYFLRCKRTVNVNGKPTNDRLLSDGDKIELSPRCRFRFRLPHAASTTAVIELTGARLVRGDIKRIVLMDRQMVLGAGPACHIRAEGADKPIILCIRDGRLVCQSPQTVKVGADPYDPSAGVPMDTPVTVGAVSFRITEA